MAARDYIPPISYCRNCHRQLQEVSVCYCSHCGQKNTDGRVSALEVLRDKLADLIQLDSRSFRTLASLIVPGKLTVEYFKGRHQRFLSPLRLFLVSSVLLIALVSVAVNRGIDGRLDTFTPGDDKKWHHYRGAVQLDTLAAQLIQERDSAISSEGRELIDTLTQRFRGSEAFSDSLNFTLQGLGSDHTPTRISKEDYYSLTPSEIVEKYEVEGFMNQLLFRQQIRFMRSGSSFILYVIGKSTWALLLLMPLFALVLKLFYVQHPFYYVEHLVFSMHVHTALFLFIISAVLLQVGSGLEATSFIMLGILLYIILAMRRFYRQSWGKTILKFLLLNTVYVFLLIFLVVLMAVVGFLLF
jgi:hypothetical protein